MFDEKVFLSKFINNKDIEENIIKIMKYFNLYIDSNNIIQANNIKSDSVNIINLSNKFNGEIDYEYATLLLNKELNATFIKIGEAINFHVSPYSILSVVHSESFPKLGDKEYNSFVVEYSDNKINIFYGEENCLFVYQGSCISFKKYLSMVKKLTNGTMTYNELILKSKINNVFFNKNDFTTALPKALILSNGLSYKDSKLNTSGEYEREFILFDEYLGELLFVIDENKSRTTNIKIYSDENLIGEINFNEGEINRKTGEFYLDKGDYIVNYDGIKCYVTAEGKHDCYNLSLYNDDTVKYMDALNSSECKIDAFDACNPDRQVKNKSLYVFASSVYDVLVNTKKRADQNKRIKTNESN